MRFIKTCWKLFESSLHKYDSFIKRLFIHLFNQQSVQFDNDFNFRDIIEISDERRIKLITFFELN